MPDDVNNDPAGAAGDDGKEPAGEPNKKKDDNTEPKGDDVVTADDLKTIKSQLDQVTALAQKQNDIIKALTGLGENDPKKSDADRILELESSIKLLSQKLEDDANAKKAAELKARTELVDKFIREQPTYKSMRDDLLKADPTLLEKIVSTTPRTTADPLQDKQDRRDDWSKKIAAATQRRIKRAEARAAIRT